MERSRWHLWQWLGALGGGASSGDLSIDLEAVVPRKRLFRKCSWPLLAPPGPPKSPPTALRRRPNAPAGAWERKLELELGQARLMAGRTKRHAWRGAVARAGRAEKNLWASSRGQAPQTSNDAKIRYGASVLVRKFDMVRPYGCTKMRYGASVPITVKHAFLDMVCPYP